MHRWRGLAIALLWAARATYGNEPAQVPERAMLFTKQGPEPLAPAEPPSSGSVAKGA